ncbi:MAG: hypothetical protein FHK80_08075 [Azoarcus sp. PHD]|nr:MAG: hypothetical protein FHK80_08075 [Azoarcus sp. PHD]
MRLLALFFALWCSSLSFAAGLVHRDALNGRVSVLAPENFGPMPTKLLELKYPSSRRPTEVLSDDTGRVTLAFNHTNNALQPHELKEAHVVLSQSFHNLYPSAEWIRDEVIEQNGSVFIVFEMITPAIDTKIHNIMYATSVSGRMLMVAFNTTTDYSKTWLPTGKAIMSSLRVKPQ